jgi:hypothetical protein
VARRGAHLGPVRFSRDTLPGRALELTPRPDRRHDRIRRAGRSRARPAAPDDRAGRLVVRMTEVDRR